MLAASDLPLQATGTPDPALMNQWGRTEWVAKRAQPHTGFNLSTDYDPTAMPEYDFEALLETFHRKLIAFEPVFERRVAVAQQKGWLLSPPPALLENFAFGVCFFAADPAFDTLSVLFTEDGEIELSRITADRRNIDYLSFEFDPDTQEIVVLFSRFQDKQSIINIDGSLQEILQQIVGLEKK